MTPASMLASPSTGGSLPPINVASTAQSGSRLDSSGSRYDLTTGNFTVGGKQSNTLIYVLGAVAFAFLYFRK